MLMLDLCAGLGGASRAMRDRGWDVVTLDNDPQFDCTITADLCAWAYSGPRPDLVWISPPCTEFSREFMPWCKTGQAPDLSIALAARRIVEQVQPRYWVIENVKGALPWLCSIFGPPRHIQNPYFLWGYFPCLGRPRLDSRRQKETYSSTWAAERAIIPYALSTALAIAVEQQIDMFNEVLA